MHHFRVQAAALVLCGACHISALAAPPTAPVGYQVLPWAARKPVPVLQATDLNGKVWRLADLRGKVVLINFWASWCEPCRAEMPSLQSLANQHADKMLVLAVNLKEPVPTIAQFVQPCSC